MVPLASLSGLQSVFAPRGPAAERIAHLGGAILITFGVVTVVMYAIILWVALRRRGTLAEHEPADAGGESWILIGGFAVPAVILAVFFVSALSTMSAFPLSDGDQRPPDIVVTAQQWWWQAEYMGDSLSSRMMTANELHIPVGKPVDVVLHSNDVIHSFWIPQLHGKVDVVPGQENRIRLLATTPGRYRGECAEFCGEEHARMAIWVTADSPQDYAKWMAGQRAPAAQPATAEQARGETLFQTRACVLCHSIRGTAAHGTVGPDLTHIGSRPTIAAGFYPNNDAYLTAWVTHAQSLKPGAKMPDLTVFTGQDLHDLVAYLRHLQ